jgi:hypothetical protein
LHFRTGACRQLRVSGQAAEVTKTESSAYLGSGETTREDCDLLQSFGLPERIRAVPVYFCHTVLTRSRGVLLLVGKQHALIERGSHTIGTQRHKNGQSGDRSHAARNFDSPVVPRAGVERPSDNGFLSPVMAPLPNLTKRYKPVFTRLAVVKVSLRLASYQHVPSPS